MTTKTMELHQDQASLDDLLSFVAAGIEVVLTENDKPLARLVPIQTQSIPKPRIAGLHPGAIQINEDFGEPLPDKFWLCEE